MCTGPDDEVALLGSLCGFAAPEGVGVRGAPRWSWIDPDVAVSLGDAFAPQLLIYATAPGPGDTNQAATARVAAFVDVHPGGTPVDDWRASEAVKSGSAQLAGVGRDPCGDWFSGSADFLWRSTTIHVVWAAGPPGC
jgi:hypothetical protein